MASEDDHYRHRDVGHPSRGVGHPTALGDRLQCPLQAVSGVQAQPELQPATSCSLIEIVDCADRVESDREHDAVDRGACVVASRPGRIGSTRAAPRDLRGGEPMSLVTILWRGA
jgi:hypothetical protein